MNIFILGVYTNMRHKDKKKCRKLMFFSDFLYLCQRKQENDAITSHCGSTYMVGHVLGAAARLGAEIPANR
jgi:hypothetical protein